MARAPRTEIPGEADEPTHPDTEGVSQMTPDDAAAQIAALRAMVAEQSAAISQLMTERAKQAPAPDSVVYTPETPHGKERMAESPVSHLTAAQVAAMIDAGELPEPTTSYLCADGYLPRRSSRE